MHRLKIHELAIGCENCHGPGSLHVDFHQAGQRLGGKDDPTIVNPGKLPRSGLEAVCAVCHLNSQATTYVRGRDIAGFRPGMSLSDVRIDYRYEVGSEQMTVVGHIEQLQRIRNVAGPEDRHGRRCDQMRDLLPLQQQLDEAIESFRCFT